VGCETAVWLAQQGNKVTVIEVLSDLMLRKPRVFHANRTMLVDMLRFHGVKILTNTRPIEVTDEGLLIQTACNKKETLQSDTVVLSVGVESDRKLYEALLGERPNLYLIGDAREPRNIMGAIWDAFEVARAI
jgi:2-enoate reductase